MPGATQPWLDDLPEEWIPQETVPVKSVRKSNSIASPSPKRPTSTVNTPVGSVRKSLTQLNQSTQNARTVSPTFSDCEKTGTVRSVASVLRYDTVERQASPNKKEAALTWKKRLVEGDLGYGDQTDLFGPSGLENIFSPAKPATPVAKATSKLQRCEVPPSSPPALPSSMFRKQDNDFSHSSMPDSNQSLGDEDGDKSICNSLTGSINNDISCGSVINERALELGKAQNFRNFSGQTDIGNETFSPVMVGKHIMDGEVVYKPADAETIQAFHNSSVQTTFGAQQTTTGESSEIQAPPATVEEDSIPHIESSLMPDNVIENTPPITRLGSFVNTNRGGLSNCGSFKTRPLSPTATEDRQSSVVIESVEIQDFAAQVQSSPGQDAQTPRTPKRDNISVVPELPTPRSSKSPLKLFGAYDTFTNGKLLRRLSQLEDSGGNVQGQPMNDSQHEQHSSTDLSCGSPQVLADQQDSVQSKLGNFGEHDLDEYDFEANISFPSLGSQRTRDDLSEGSPDPDALPPGARSSFMFHLEDCDDTQETFGIKRKLSDRSTAKSGRSTAPTYLPDVQPKSPVNDEGKRFRDSPVKAPTPKRQRTLHELDFAMERLAQEEEPSEEHEQHNGYDLPTIEIYSGSPAASIHTAAQSRPRNPTPSQQRWSDIMDEEEEKNKQNIPSPEMRAIRDKIAESSLPGSIKLVTQTKAVANDLATFTLNVARNNEAGERKRSITTQDFLHEAMHIMSLIRARGRPTSGLGSVDESNAASAIQHDDESDKEFEQGSSVLRVSRPPSREGSAPGWRPRSHQQDLRVPSQLRKYQEKDEIDIVETTVHSLKLRGLMEEDEYSEFEDGSRADIRIAGPRSNDDQDQQHGDEEVNINTAGSDQTVEYSTGRTQHSAGSRKSENVATLAPNAVAHLIPEQVGGMTFDKTQNRWVKEKQSAPLRNIEKISLRTESTLTSDDDPFDNIPDLTVDEIHEMDRIRSSQSWRLATNTIANPVRGHARFSSQDDTTFAQPTAGQDKTHSALKSSVLKGPSILDSSRHQIETRATSWSTEHAQKQVAHLDELSEDSMAFEHDGGTAPYRPSEKADLVNFSDDVTNEWEQDSDVEELPPQQQPQQAHRRKVSFQAQAFRQRRFGTEVDQSELSMVAELPDKRLVSVSVAVSRPLTVNNTELASLQYDSPSMILSDLPEFTVAEIDRCPGLTEQVLASTVARHGMEIEGDRYALAVQHLVKTLTDVKGDEPYWEEMKHLSLSQKGLDTLHGLGDFCTRLQQLDVSGNAVTQLDGAPLHVRWLNASHNALSSMTAWSRLVHLQYLDISHNDISELDGLGCLIHLRELKASHNNITSLNGLMDVEGLQKLDVSHNEIRVADFSRCRWTQLETLDLNSNKLSQVVAIRKLSALKRLSLSDNDVRTLDLTSDAPRASELRYLSASNNKLHTIDLSELASMRYLDLDDNRIGTLPGLDRLKELDTLSLRRQDVLDSSVWEAIMSRRMHARSVHLSGNSLPSDLATPTVQNTISHLELASCGLLSLSRNFGLRFPNLSHLNLNFNALKDIRCVLNVPRLETLYLAGNRLGRLRKCVETLARLPALKNVDLRDNAVNMGFYPALGTADQASSSNKVVAVKNGMGGSGRAASSSSSSSSWSLAEVQRVKEARYTLSEITAESDAAHQKLMDEDTRLRRRVHEILVASGCPALEVLDGVDVDRAKILRRDQAWERLKELGVLKPKGGG